MVDFLVANGVGKEGVCGGGVKFLGERVCQQKRCTKFNQQSGRWQGLREKFKNRIRPSERKCRHFVKKDAKEKEERLSGGFQSKRRISFFKKRIAARDK